MLDYYKILGVSRSADYAMIRSAYKKLALQYHPDRNPNNKAAEEFFKVVNEAKQLLSNPQKRAQYDLLLNYIYESAQRKVARQTYRSYRYSRGVSFGYSGQYYTAHPVYKIDKNYYRVQLLTLMVVALISVFTIGIFKANEYLEEKKAEEMRIRNEKVFTEAQAFYDQGNYRKALNLVINLVRKNPVDTKFFNRKEKMVAGLNHKSIILYQQADYKKAVANLEILQEYQNPIRLSTWSMIADCNYKLGNFEKAIHALEYIALRDKENIDVVIRIGDIYYDNLHMIDKALQYYDEAKNIFKASQRALYGKAFELIMPAEKAPQVYFKMFSKRAEINMAAGFYKEAITDYNWASYLRPHDGKSYHYRAICRQQSGDFNRACNDWRKALALGAEESKLFMAQYCR